MGREEHPQNYLFSVEWDVKPQSVSRRWPVLGAWLAGCMLCCAAAHSGCCWCCVQHWHGVVGIECYQLESVCRLRKYLSFVELGLSFLTSRMVFVSGWSELVKAQVSGQVVTQLTTGFFSVFDRRLSWTICLVTYQEDVHKLSSISTLDQLELMYEQQLCWCRNQYSTQPPILSGTGNEYQPVCLSCAIGSCGLFHLFVGCAGDLVCAFSIISNQSLLLDNF